MTTMLIQFDVSLGLRDAWAIGCRVVLNAQSETAPNYYKDTVVAAHSLFALHSLTRLRRTS